MLCVLDDQLKKLLFGLKLSARTSTLYVESSLTFAAKDGDSLGMVAVSNRSDTSETLLRCLGVM